MDAQIPGLAWSPGGGHGNPLQYSGHEEYSGVTAEKLVLYRHANNLTFWDHMRYDDPVCVV